MLKILISRINTSQKIVYIRFNPVNRILTVHSKILTNVHEVGLKILYGEGFYGNYFPLRQNDFHCITGVQCYYCQTTNYIRITA